MKSTHCALLAVSLLGSATAFAGNETNAAESISAPSSASGLLLGKLKGETAFDKAWSAFTLYKDETNPILQEFSLQGQFQLQYADGHSSEGHFDTADRSGQDNNTLGDSIEFRRARAGFKSKWFGNWKFDGQMDVNLNNNGATIYSNIYEAVLTYAPNDALNASIGKREMKFGREHEISSKEILTFERSLVDGLLFPGELTGAWVSGKGIEQHWSYELGVYANDRAREFSELNGGTIFLAKVGYDYASQVGLDSAVAAIHYMHNTEPGFKSTDKNRSYSFSSSPGFTDSLALTNDIVQGRFGLTTDLLFGFGDNNLTKPQANVAALTLIPSYYIADGLQLVGQFQAATSGSADGIKLNSRYEGASASPDKVGNSYASAYLGVNYYIYGHKLKLMNGVQYAYLGGGDYSGTTFLSGLRMSF
jgi:phosphate-selective porin OprO and OprP